MSDTAAPVADSRVLLPAELPSADKGVTVSPPKNPFDAAEHSALTAQKVAYRLIWMLAASVVAQYVALGVLVWRSKGESIPVFEHLFNAWLPVIAGLASSAVTYYLTKDKK
jgi:hypothetical protein